MFLYICFILMDFQSCTSLKSLSFYVIKILLKIIDIVIKIVLKIIDIYVVVDKM